MFQEDEKHKYERILSLYIVKPTHFYLEYHITKQLLLQEKYRLGEAVFYVLFSSSFLIPKIRRSIPLRNFGLSIVTTFTAVPPYLDMVTPRKTIASDRIPTTTDLGHSIAINIPKPKAEKYKPVLF